MTHFGPGMWPTLTQRDKQRAFLLISWPFNRCYHYPFISWWWTLRRREVQHTIQFDAFYVTPCSSMWRGHVTATCVTRDRGRHGMTNHCVPTPLSEPVEATVQARTFFICRHIITPRLCVPNCIKWLQYSSYSPVVRMEHEMERKNKMWS